MLCSKETRHALQMPNALCILRRHNILRRERLATLHVRFIKQRISPFPSAAAKRNEVKWFTLYDNIYYNGL
jgi:hypothetical protein